VKCVELRLSPVIRGKREPGSGGGVPEGETTGCGGGVPEEETHPRKDVVTESNKESRMRDAAKIVIAHLLMIVRPMMLGKVVCRIAFSWLPEEVGLVLTDSVLQPVIQHVERFGASHSDFGFENAVGSRVVSFQRSP
jgi:hypothetical protein